MKYEEIKDLKVSELSEMDFKIWLMDEVTSLSNDFGQKIDNEMLLHTCRRLNGVLLGKYRSWHIGTIHAAFQTGLSGNYGVFNKVTVKALLHFLNMAQKQMTERKVTAAKEESDRRHCEFNPIESTIIDFLVWASVKMICLSFVDPEHVPKIQQCVSPKIASLAEDWMEAKDMDLLPQFENHLKAGAEKYAELCQS